MTEFDPAKIAHLEMVQNAISRMASNSFALKALAGALTAGVLAFAGAAQNPSPVIALAVLAPVVMFWLLDAQYLRRERLFRRLFDGIRGGEREEPFDMDYRLYQSDEPHAVRIAVSWSVVGFYAPILIVLIVLLVILAL